MLLKALCIALAVTACKCQGSFYLSRYNVTRTPPPGIAEYRSALTLDWMKAEEYRQKEAVEAIGLDPPEHEETGGGGSCIGSPRPAPGKVARLLLETLKNLEGDDGVVITRLMQRLIQSHLLMETSSLESEPDLETLVKTPALMMGEPHSTFPKVLAILWLVTTDPVTTKRDGWCSVMRVNRYLSHTRPAEVARRLRELDPVLERARYIIEDFVQSVTPLRVNPETTARSRRINYDSDHVMPSSTASNSRLYKFAHNEHEHHDHNAANMRDRPEQGRTKFDRVDKFDSDDRRLNHDLYMDVMSDGHSGDHSGQLPTVDPNVVMKSRRNAATKQFGPNICATFLLAAFQ